jgi:hypothetical protein
MFGSLIKSIAEFTGQIVGETVHQVGEAVSATICPVNSAMLLINDPNMCILF